MNNATTLSHNAAHPEVTDAPDFWEDPLDLAMQPGSAQQAPGRMRELARAWSRYLYPVHPVSTANGLARCASAVRQQPVVRYGTPCAVHPWGPHLTASVMYSRKGMDHFLNSRGMAGWRIRVGGSAAGARKQSYAGRISRNRKQQD